MSIPDGDADQTTQFGTFVEPKTGSRPTVPQQRAARTSAGKPGATNRRGADALTSPSAKWLHQRRAALAGLALAAPAYSRPLWWLAAAAGLLCLCHTARLLKPAVAGGALSPAALIVLPIRAVLAALGALPPAIGQLLLLLARALVCIALAVVATGGATLLYDAATNGGGCAQALDAVHRWALPLGAYVAASGYVATRLKTSTGTPRLGRLRKTFDNTGETGLIALVAVAAVGGWLAYQTGWNIDIPSSLAEASDWNYWKSELLLHLNDAVLTTACNR